jgi:hypothetical protein
MNVSDQRLAVARLTTYCEIIITRGLLPMDKEAALRALVNSTCNAFDMASAVERDIPQKAPGETTQPPLPERFIVRAAHRASP